MRFGVICAMQEEFDGIINCVQLQFKQTVNIASCDYQIYQYKQHEIIMLICGIGKVNSASATQALICTFKPDYIVNVGVAGGLSTELSFGDVVIATDLVQHDMDVRSFGIPLGQIPRMDTFSFACDQHLIDIAMNAFTSNEYKVVSGRIASGDQFIDNKQTAQFIYNEFNALACEMEGAAIAHVCHLNKVPFVVIRSLSDMAGIDDVAAHSFSELKEVSANRAAQIILHILESI
jgi:adenosylhomocysteine nucleosidase